MTADKQKIDIKKAPRGSANRETKPLVVYGWLVLLTLLIHGLVLLNDGIYLDGWRDYYFNGDGRLNEWYDWLGIPQVGYFHNVMVLFPGSVYGYKLLSFITLLLIAGLVYALSQQIPALAPIERVFLAIISTTYPAYEHFAQSNAQFYQLSVAAFLTGALLLVRWPNLMTRIMAIILFTLSFTTASLLVFYGMVILGLGIRAVWPVINSKQFSKDTLIFSLKNADLITLPAIYWIAKQLIFPNTESYNQITLFDSPRLFVRQMAESVYNATIWQGLDLVRTLNANPFLIVVLLALTGAVYRVLIGRLAIRKIKSLTFGLIGYGVIGLVLGILPYAAVQKPVLTDAAKSENALLVAMPMAIILLGGLRLIAHREARLASALGSLILAGCGLLTVQSHFAWQAYWVKNYAVIVTLQDADIEYDTLWVYDDYHDNYITDQTWPNIHHALRGVWYDPYDGLWDAPQKTADTDFGEPPYPVINVLNPLYDERPWIVEYFRPVEGCDAFLLIDENQGTSDQGDLHMVFEYYGHHLRGDVRDYLKNVIRISIAPIRTPAQPGCPPAAPSKTPVLYPNEDIIPNLARWFVIAMPDVITATTATPETDNLSRFVWDNLVYPGDVENPETVCYILTMDAALYPDGQIMKIWDYPRYKTRYWLIDRCGD